MGFSDFFDKIKKSHIFSHGRKHNTAIILAAGIGARMGRQDKTKQLLLLDGKPLICKTIDVFENSDEVNEIIIVAKEDEIPLYDDFINKNGWKKLSSVIAGGETRQDSVFNGIKAAGDRADYFIIHDGARCFVTEKIISDVLSEARIHGAAIAAETAVDTIKYSTSAGYIKNTIDRNHVYRAQTPQIFKSEIIIAAYYYADEKNIKATDDASLVEELGLNIKLVDCGHKNIKITYNDDLDYAEYLLGKENK